jgi:hypothetical protein
MRHARSGLSALLAVLFLAGIFYWHHSTSANLAVPGSDVLNTATLAPELRLARDNGLEMQTLMTLAELAGQSLSQGVRPDRFEEFMRSSRLITDDMRSRINYSMMATDGNEVRVVYNGAKGPVVLAFSKKSAEGPSAALSSNSIALRDVVVRIAESVESSGPQIAPTDDIAGSAQGNNVMHEGPKVIKKKPIEVPAKNWFKRLFGGTETDYVDVHEREPVYHSYLKGVNDFIRMHFEGKDVEVKRAAPLSVRNERGHYDLQDINLVSDAGLHFSELPQEDMPLMLAALKELPGGDKIISSIRDKGYKIFVYKSIPQGDEDGEHNYGTGPISDDLIPGMDTHYGIRTGCIHISWRAYRELRLGKSGTHNGKPYFLAARIAHEVTEIDLWRAKAAELVKQGKIESLGTVEAEYTPKWKNGIRKWIIDNCKPDGKGEAQALDREYHKLGVELELTMRAYTYMNLMPKETYVKPEFIPEINEMFYPTTIEIAEEILKWGRVPGNSFTFLQDISQKNILRKLDFIYKDEKRASLNELIMRVKGIYAKRFGPEPPPPANYNELGAMGKANLPTSQKGGNGVSVPNAIKGHMLGTHFTSYEEEVPIFLNYILARAYLWEAQNQGGDISLRLNKFKERVSKLDVIDRLCKVEIMAWLSKAGRNLESVPSDKRAGFLALIGETSKVVAGKNSMPSPKPSLPYDKTDTVGSAQGPGQSEEQGAERRDEGRGMRGEFGEGTEFVSADVQREIDGFIRSFAGSLESDAAWGGVAAPAASESGPKGVVIYADDIVNSSAVFDAGKLAGLIGKEGKLLSKVVLYAKDPRKAEIIEKVIKDNNPEAEVITVTEDALKAHYGDSYYKISSVEAVLRYTLNRDGEGAFTRPDQILGVVRGALTKDEDADAIQNELRRGSLKVPVVAFENGLPGNIYSIVQAITKLAQLRANQSEGIFFYILPPITRVTEALQQEYQQYLYLLKKLAAAA